jgi:hypothetical protein
MARFGKATLVAAVAVTLVYLGTREVRRHQMRAAVVARAIAIDEVKPDWDTYKHSPGDSTLALSLVLRNTSGTAVRGTCVFRGVVKHNALQAGYVRSFVSKYRESEDFRRQIDAWPIESVGPRGHALLTALHRPGGSDAARSDEPVEGMKDPEYVFTFREDCNLRPGEVDRLAHSQVLPNAEMGFVFKIELVDLE